jgi:hypothetical protein
MNVPPGWATGKASLASESESLKDANYQPLVFSQSLTYFSTSSCAIPKENVAFTGYLIDFIIGQFAPFFLHLTSELFPVTLYLIPVHLFLLSVHLFLLSVHDNHLN